MPWDKDRQIEFDERAGIMEFCGGLPRAEAERLARERPWDKDPCWGMPKPEQLTFEDDPLAAQFFREMKRLYGE